MEQKVGTTTQAGWAAELVTAKWGEAVEPLQENSVGRKRANPRVERKPAKTRIGGSSRRR